MVGSWLIGNSERYEHEAQNVHTGNEFELHRFMIFMTDGENKTNPSYDPDGTGAEQDDIDTKARCDQIKADGIEIYTVAFQAPERGRELLRYCATPDVVSSDPEESEIYYYNATDEESFLEAFDRIAERIESSIIRIVD